MNQRKQLRDRITAKEILLAPGTYDPLMAKIISHAGFEAVYMTGAGVSHSMLASPDLGLMTMSEMVDRAAQIVDASELPVICDADTGYGNAINVMRTVREYERAGVAAIHIEDQEMPKRCGHFLGKTLVPVDEMVGKLHAALDTRRDPDFQIIARTDARTALGYDQALDRANAYAEAGADVIFFESPRSLDELAAIPKAINKPLLANMVETGLTPLLSAPELEALGYSLVIFAGGLSRFLCKQAEGFLATLKQEGTTASYMNRMNTFQRQNEILELHKFEELAKKYGGAAGET